MSSTIAPESILRELAELWVSLGKQPEEEGSTGVLRACSMTLLVVTDEADDPTNLGETIAALMPEHPSRAIVVRVHPSEKRSLSSRVFAQCWMPFGQRRQICCEQIEITASEASLPEIPGVILPIAVPDLPVIMWCRSPRLFQLPEFPLLAAVAQKIVIDSSLFPEPIDVLQRLLGASKSGHTLGDLAWTRLTRWRQMISQIFESRKFLARLPEIGELRISFSGEQIPVTAWYLAAWFLDSTKVAGASVQLELQPTGGESSGLLNRVELLPRDGQGLHISLERVEGQTIEIRIDALVHRMMLPALNDYQLMREELSIPGRDAVFENALMSAAGLTLSSRSQ